MKLFPSISDDLAAWAQRQPVFFTATAGTFAPHINVSPKGLLSTHFSILSPHLCAYIDRTGSGNETISHAYDNARLCLMWMSFGPTPRILRFFCTSRVVEWDHPEFDAWVRRVSGGKREAFDGARAVIVADVWEVQTSCGYGVPRVKKALYAPANQDGEIEPLDPAIETVLCQGWPSGNKLDELAVFEERPTLDTYWATQAEIGKAKPYQEAKNVTSIDGLPGLRAARKGAGETLWIGDLKARLLRIGAQTEGIALGFVVAVLLYLTLACTRLLPVL